MKKFISQHLKDILINLIASVIILLAVFLIYQIGKMLIKPMTDQMANFIAFVIFAICFAIWVLKYYSDKNKKEKYYSTVSSKEFKQFTIDVMKRYYGESYLTEINGTVIPEYCLPTSGKIKYGTSVNYFDVLCNKKESKISDFNINNHFNYKKNKFYKQYRRINKNEVRSPNRPGFMLEKISINSDGLVDNITVRLGTSAENVYTSDVLEYELYEAYLRFKAEWKNIKEKNIGDELFWEKINNSLEMRNKISNENGSPYNSLINGKGRESLVSVQMIVVIKSRGGQYEVKRIQRSKNVAQAPGEYQLAPCGGFEIFNDSADDNYDDSELDENLSPGAAIFREYLEELCKGEDFEGKGAGSVNDKVLKDPRIQEICKMLESKKASLQFLGSSVSLLDLRHTLSFALVIHDDSYSEKNQFIGNHESKKGRIASIPVHQLDNPEDKGWKKMNAGSKASWHLFKNTKEYEDIVKKDDLINDDKTSSITV